MREDFHIKQDLAAHLQQLPAAQIKQAMIKWLGEYDSSLETLQKTLNSDCQMTYGAIDNEDRFIPLSEKEMIRQSLSTLEDYQNNGNRFSHQSVADLIGVIDSRLEPNNTTSSKTTFQKAVIDKLG